MNTVNRVFIVGRLGKDPKAIEKDDAIIGCNFSIATSKSIPDGEDWREVTEWHNVTVWAGKGKLVEKLILPYVKKGHLVAIEGELRTTRSEKDGVTHYNTGITVIPGGFAHLTSKKEAEAMVAAMGGDAAGGDDDEEVPF